MRVYEIVLMPPGYPIILLKSNEFNMASVSVKRSIDLSLDLKTLTLSASLTSSGSLFHN